MNYKEARESMVENQLRPNKIIDKRIFKIFNEIEKEFFLNNDLKKIAYSDVDLCLTNKRGYLKNLHIAQLVQHANIKSKDKILHIGGLTGYVTLILSKLSNSIVVIEDDKLLLNELEENLIEHKVTNVEIIYNDLNLGYKEKCPYDLIFIDCPLQNVSKIILDQINFNHGRLIMIEKINDNLGKCILVTKNNNNYNKEILFDVFSNFILYQNKERFIF